MMKKVFLVAALTVLSICSFAQWAVDKGHSKPTFTVTHHGISEVEGYFKKYDATLTATKDDLSDAVFEINIDAASINTDLEMRDNSLRGEDLFDVTKYPTIHFISTSFKKKQGNQYLMQGNLTIKGITKPISLDVTMNGPVPNPNANVKGLQIGIKATGTINRSDFHVGGGLTNAFVSDEVQIRVTGEFGKTL
jgi:polyisoprenoid-binding protein YceI